jgi:hypothetical protein
MFILKTKRKNGVHLIPFIIASFLMSIVIISCGGCASSKTKALVDKRQTDTFTAELRSKKQADNIKSSNNESIVNINDSTKIVHNVEITYSKVKNETIVKLPNGTKMSSTENVYLLKEIPLNAIKRDQYNSPYIDLQLISNSVKKNLFEKMNRAESIKLDNLKSAGFSSSIEICGDKNNYLCKNTSIYVKGHDENEDENNGWGVGQIGYSEIYDLQGKKLLAINRNKNGGRLKTLSESSNIIIFYREGDDEGSFYGYLWPVLEVYELSSGKLLSEIRTLGYSGEIMTKQDKVYFYSGHLYEGNSTCFYLLDYKMGNIYFYKYKYGEPNAVTIDYDNILLSNGTKININNTDKVLKFSIDDWNRYVDSLWKKKHEL